MPPSDAAVARDLAGRVHVFGADDSPPTVPSLIADAMSARRVLRISYGDRQGVASTREIEPLGFVGNAPHWYLVAWCRRREAVRAFRTDRIAAVSATAEVPTPRALRREDLDIPDGVLRQLALT